MDTHPQIIGFHMALGEQVCRLDQLETRVWNEGNRGLYKSDELPDHRADAIAGNVVLALAYIAFGRVR